MGATLKKCDHTVYASILMLCYVAGTKWDQTKCVICLGHGGTMGHRSRFQVVFIIAKLTVNDTATVSDNTKWQIMTLSVHISVHTV